MAEKKTGSKEKKVDKILAEDKDLIIDPSEIARIFKLYIGRTATPEENDRFTGMKESEHKILIDYLNQQRDKEKLQLDATKEEEKLQMVANQDEMKNQLNTNKVKNDLSVKGMKAIGNKNIDMMRGKPIAPMPQMGQMLQGDRGPMFEGSNMNNENMNPENKKIIRDGRFSLVKFE